MKISDPRAQSLIVFHKLRRELSELEDEPSDELLTRIVAQAAHLLPEYDVTPTDRTGIVIVRRLSPPGDYYALDIRAYMDAFRSLWREYREFLRTKDAEA